MGHDLRIQHSAATKLTNYVITVYICSCYAVISLLQVDDAMSTDASNMKSDSFCKIMFLHSLIKMIAFTFFLKLQHKYIPS